MKQLFIWILLALSACAQISCSCINKESDAVARALMWRARADLKPLASAKSGELSVSQKGYLDFYGIDQTGKNRLGSFESGELSLCGQFLSPQNSINSKGTVIFVHGYFDHSCSHVNVINHLKASGFHVAAYDHPGHGLSEGKKVAAKEFDVFSQGFSDFFNLVSDELPPPYHVVAHSMGSAVVIDYLDENREHSLENIVFVAPLIRDTKSRGLHMMGSAVSPVIHYIIRITEENSSDSNYKDFTAADPLQFQCVSTGWAVAFNRWRRNFDTTRPRTESPLIIFAGDDNVVDNSVGRPWLKTVFPAGRQIEVEGAGHQLLNELEEYRHRALNLISKELRRD